MRNGLLNSNTCCKIHDCNEMSTYNVNYTQLQDLAIDNNGYNRRRLVCLCIIKLE